MKLLVLTIVAVVASAVPVPYKNCGKPADIIQLTSVGADKWPPVRGQPMTLSVWAQVSRQINDGDYEAVIKFNGFQILDKKGKLSDIKNISLPIRPGTYSQNVTVTVPSWIPAGQVDAHITTFDNTGAECLCLDISIPLKETEDNMIEFEALEDAPVSMVGVPIPYKNCGGPNDIAKITNAVADIWPPQKGKPIGFTLNATLSQAIPNGNYNAKVKWNGIQIVDKQGKISDLKNVTLPIPAGPYGISKRVNLPSWIPSGQIDVHIDATSTASGNPRIACIELSVKIS
jgi:hypothetical protein